MCWKHRVALKCRQSPAAGICLQVSEPQSRVFMVRILIKTPGQKQQVLAVFLSVTEGIIIQNIRKNVDTGGRVRTEHLDDKSLAFRLSAISLAAQCRSRWGKEPEELIMSCCVFFLMYFAQYHFSGRGGGDKLGFWGVTDTQLPYAGFPGVSEGNNSPANAGDISSIPVSGRSARVGNGSPLQYSCLENPMDRGAWCTAVHEVKKSQT